MEPRSDNSALPPGPLEHVWHGSRDRTAVAVRFILWRAVPLMCFLALLAVAVLFLPEGRVACLGGLFLVFALLLLGIAFTYLSTISMLKIDEDGIRVRQIMDFSKARGNLLRWPTTNDSRTAVQWPAITEIITRHSGDGAIVFIYTGTWHHSGHFPLEVARALESSLARAKARAPLPEMDEKP